MFNLSNETLKLISYICFGAGGLSALITILLFILPKKKAAQSPYNITVEEDITSVNTDEFIN